MKLTNLLSILILLLSIKSFPQSFSLNWNKSYGLENDENGNSIVQTKDGGYILAGYTKSLGAGESDSWLIRFNSDGDTLWTKVFGGASWDWGQTVIETDDGGFLFSVRCYSFGAGYYDAWLIKTNAKGDTLWTKLWGGENSEWITCADRTSDAGYIYTGRTSSFDAEEEDIWLIKSDSLGNIIWNKTIGGELVDNAAFVQETNDKGFIIAGRTYSFGTGGSDIWLIKTNEYGDTIWTKAYGGSGSDYGVSVSQSIEGGYLLVGNTNSFGNESSDIWVLKTDSLGDTLWTKIIGGVELERAFTLNLLPNGYSLIGGVTSSYGAGLLDGWAIILDEVGNIYWSQTFGQEENDMILGSTINKDGEIIFTGYTSLQEDNADLWIMNLSIEYPSSLSTVAIQNEYNLFQNYPNPFNPSTTIKYSIPNQSNVTLKVFDVLGSEVATLVNREQPQGNYEIEFDASTSSATGSELSSRIYFYRLQAGNFIETKKMILLK